MIKIKKDAFTLSEVLITLAIVGTLALLVVPGLVRDVSNKAMMALLQGTIVNLNDAIQAELISSRATDIKDTLMWTNPKKFLRDNFDIARECSATFNSPCHGPAIYGTLNGGTSGTAINIPVLLKNGVAIDLINTTADNNIMVLLDLNGGKEPNIVGVDLYYLFISGTTNLDKGIRMGDLRGLLQEGIGKDPHTVTNEELKALCKSGWGSPCYMLVERSGFDHNYWK